MSDTDIPYFCIVQYQTTHKHNEKKNIQTGIIPQVSKIEVTVMGSTMHLCGLTDGDIVYVSPNISPTPGDIIFVHTNGKPSLQVYSPDTADIPDIIGVVCGVFIPERPLKAEFCQTNKVISLRKTCLIRKFYTKYNYKIQNITITHIIDSKIIVK